MDPLTLTTIIVAIIAIIVAGVGIYFALWGIGYFQYLGGKKPGRLPPVRKNTLIKALISLNDNSKPYQIVKGTESDLVAEWKIADATWYGIFSKNKLKTAYRAFLLVDELRHSVRCYEEYRSITWSVGTSGLEPVIHYQKSFFGGRILFKKTYGIGYGFRTTDPRSAGKVYEYRFDIDEIRDPIIATVEANGWEWVPVTGKRNVTYPPGTGPDRTDDVSDDQFCMVCGARLDERTKNCPRCGIHPALHEEKDQAAPMKEPVPVTQPPKPPADKNVQGPAYPPPYKSPSSGIPVKKIVIGLVIVFIVIVLAGVIFGLFNGPAEKSVFTPPALGNNSVNRGPSPVMPVTSPTDIVPPNTEVYVQVAKSPITKEISVIFSGGPGQNVVKELDIRVTRSDGEVLTANLIPRQQSEATISGSKGDDRVEVFAIHYSGQKYKVFDEIMKERVIV
jgi:hypothetical protein